MTTALSGAKPTSDQVRIAPARLIDLWRLRRLQRRAFRSDLAYSIGALALLHLLPDTPFLVATRGRQILGCAIGDRSNGLSRVINICVDPDARRCGIGEHLLQALEAALPEGDMLLLVQEENDPARLLYEKRGYHATGVARNYYGTGQHGIWMRKPRSTPNGTLSPAPVNNANSYRKS